MYLIVNLIILFGPLHKNYKLELFIFTKKQLDALDSAMV
jgi:hypothetical protein